MIRRFVVGIGALLLGSAGCFEDPPALDTVAGSSGSSSMEGGSSTTAAADDTAGQTVVLSGRVTEVIEGTGNPPGTRVSLFGTAGVEAVTDAEGYYVLSGVPVDQVAFLVFDSSNDYAGMIVGIDVRFADLVVPDVGLVSRVAIAGLIDALRMEDPDIDYDPTRGHMVALPPEVDIDVLLEPLPADAVVFATDLLGNPILGATASYNLSMPLVAIANLPVEDEGVYQLTAEHPSKSCVVAFSSPPTLADHFTYVQVECA